MLGSLLKSTCNFAASGAWSASENSLIVSLTLSAVFPHPFSKPHSLNLKTDNNEKAVSKRFPTYRSITLIEKRDLCWNSWYGVSFGKSEMETSAAIRAAWSLSTVSSVSLIISCCMSENTRSHQFLHIDLAFGFLIFIFYWKLISAVTSPLWLRASR